MSDGGPSAPPGLFDLDAAALDTLLADEPRYRSAQLRNGLYRELLSLDDITTLPAALRARLATITTESLTPARETPADGGETVKLLWRLHDGALVETVLMSYRRRTTICVSTQAGCAMACAFCATGQVGFERHLSVGEIVEQVVRAARRAAPRRVSNVVFMGMGEPLANYDATWSALRRLQGEMGIGARHLTVSTVGLVPGIRRMAQEDLQVNLAVSLHAANDELRSSLVPVNRRWPLGELAEACRDYVEATHRRVSLEWAMIDGVNDRQLDARQLADFARPLGAHVNLIPLNRTPGYPTTGSPAERVAAFADRLRQLGVNATVRANRGADIDAACGQLRAEHRVDLGPPRRRGGAEPPPAGRL